MKKKIPFTTNLTSIKLILFSYLSLELFVVVPYLLIVNYADIQTGGIDFKDKSVIVILFIAVIFGPLLETLIFQTLIIYLVKKILPKFELIAILISGILFGLGHFYSGAYVVYTTIIGFVLAFVYIFSLKKGFNAFFVVFAIHALHNLTMFITNYL
jgi:hypothetical protein